MPQVLIVEDVPALQRFTSVALELEGYSILLASDGREGLQKIEEHLPDLVILDLFMPNFSGWDVLDAMKNSPDMARIPVIIVTASADSTIQTRAVTYNVHRLLVKPISAEQLVSAVQEVFAT